MVFTLDNTEGYDADQINCLNIALQSRSKLTGETLEQAEFYLRTAILQGLEINTLLFAPNNYYGPEVKLIKEAEENWKKYNAYFAKIKAETLLYEAAIERIFTLENTQGYTDRQLKVLNSYLLQQIKAGENPDDVEKRIREAIAKGLNVLGWDWEEDA